MDAESPLSVTTKRTLSIFSPESGGHVVVAPPRKSLSVLLIAQILQKRFVGKSYDFKSTSKDIP